MVNRIYNFIKEDKNLAKDVKLIGIGLENQPNDIEVYKKTFKVEFPMFSDPKKEIQSKVKVQLVPLIVLVDKNGKILMNHIGLIENVDAFLSQIRKNNQAK